MPVRKFRSVAEMPGARPRTPLDPDNLRIACSLSQFTYWLHPNEAHSWSPEIPEACGRSWRIEPIWTAVRSSITPLIAVRPSISSSK